MSKVRLCAQILPTGSQCTQFALRGKPFCRNHADQNRRALTAASCQIVGMVPRMNLFEVALTLYNTVFELRGKYMPPLHAYAIFEAALHRLDQILVMEAPPHLDFAPPTKPNANNGLHTAPMK
ncbi:MAG: hypothetical protein JOY95_01800 [Silvibacterium sp.]|nr:hypothetical protein [Silvibacterium sp.]